MDNLGLPVVGMVGGGQLAQMTHQAAISLGQSLRVLSVSNEDSAARVARHVSLGHHGDIDALRSFAANVDVLTFDHEHVPSELLQSLENDGALVRPSSQALLYAQDKLAMRRKLAELAIPGPAYAAVSDVADVTRFAAEHSWPVVIKAARGGYDGRGVWVVDSTAQAKDLVPGLLEAGTPLLAEAKVTMWRELSAVVARSPFGQGAAWSVVETVQENGINTEVLAPAPEFSSERMAYAQNLVLRIADELNVVGVLAVELFDIAGMPDAHSSEEALLVNELAMRPHNSGHWTIDGARTSQFEQHIRAVLDYPLGTTDMLSPACVTANVLGAPTQPVMRIDERLHHLFARYPDAKVHLYGKDERPGRKLGHITLSGNDMSDLRAKAKLGAHWLSHGSWEDGYLIH